MKKFRNCVCIIDCYEIFIERPSNLTTCAQSWSNYKHNNTVKYLIRISPTGAITFLSGGWGGRVLDKELTNQSGFFKYINFGDCILADRGFLIKDELAEKGANLYIPAFLKGKQQFSPQEVGTSRQLSNVRIHVERIIGRVKQFRILQTTVPIRQIDLLDDIMVVISALVNLNKGIIK